MTSRTGLSASTTDAIRGPSRLAAGWALLGGLALVAGVTPPARAATTELIDVGADGDPPQGDDMGSHYPVVSADGRLVAFTSGQRGIGAGDSADILVRDRGARTTERVSVASDGTPANDTSGDYGVSM